VKEEEKKPTLFPASSDVPVYEGTGKILAVIPAMKGKPATISFRPDKEGSTAMAINFDPSKTDIPALLKLQQGKNSIDIICDVSTSIPFLMSFTAPAPQV